MSDKGARDHITLPSWLCMMGSREREKFSCYLCKITLNLNCKTVYVNQSEIAKEFNRIHSKVEFCFECFVLISAILLPYFCLCTVYLSGMIVHKIETRNNWGGFNSQSLCNEAGVWGSNQNH